MSELSIDEQVQYLMRGTEYGDEDLKAGDGAGAAPAVG